MRKLFSTLVVIVTSVLICHANVSAALYNDWHDYEKQVFELVNLQRDHHAVSSLIADSRLQISADLHSQDMAERSYFSHKNPDNITPGQRIAAQGYDTTVNPGENIAAGYANPFSVMYGTDDLTQLSDFDSGMGKGGFSSWEEVGQGWSDDDWKDWGDYRSQPEIGLPTGWMGSDGHRDAILDKKFTDIGVGYYFDASDTSPSNYQGDYWTQNFAAGDTAPVPIPPSAMLFGSGLLWMAGFLRFKRK